MSRMLYKSHSRSDAGQRVHDALCALSAEAPSASQTIFRHWFSARAIAERAGVSETTARRWLDGIGHIRGFEQRRVHGVMAYRHDADRE